MSRATSAFTASWAYRAHEPDDEAEEATEATEATEPEGRKRAVSAKMRRAFDDLDPAIYREKRWRRHRRQRFVRFLRKISRLCASCGGKLDPVDGVTCVRCLQVDRHYKGEAKEVEAVARYVDEFGRPMKLRFTPRMLPVIGPRYDGSNVDWPECANLSDCLTELVRACGAKDSPGAACPRGCVAFAADTEAPVERRRQVLRSREP